MRKIQLVYVPIYAQLAFTKLLGKPDFATNIP